MYVCVYCLQYYASLWKNISIILKINLYDNIGVLYDRVEFPYYDKM